MGLSVSVIKEDGKEVFLKLLPNTSMILRDMVSMWDWDKSLRSAFNIDLQIPIEGNEIAIDFNHITNVYAEYYKWPARVYDSGVPIYYGELTLIRKTINRSINRVNVEFVAMYLVTKIGDAKLRDLLTKKINMGEDYHDIVNYMNNTVTDVWPHSPVVFYPIYAPNFYSDQQPLFCRVCNYWNQSDGQFYADQPLTSGGEPNGAWRYNCVPQVYMLEALVSIFQSLGYRTFGDVLENEFYRSITVLGMKSMDDIAGIDAKWRTTTEQVFNSSGGSIDWQVIEYNRIGSSAVTGTTPFTNPPSLMKWSMVLKLGEVSGPITVSIVLNGTNVFDSTINGEIGNEITVEGTFGAEVAASFGIHLSCSGYVVILPGSSLILSDEIGLANWWRGTFELGECLPDIMAKDFILACKQFGIEYHVNDLFKEVEITQIKKKLEESDSVPMKHLSSDSEIDFQKLDRKIIVQYKSEDVDTEGLPFIGNFQKKQDLPATNVGLNGNRPKNCYAYVSNENAFYKLSIDGGGNTYTIELMGQRNAKMSVGYGLDEVVFQHMGKIALVTNHTINSEEFLLPTFEEIGYTNWPKVVGGQWDLIFLQYYGLQDGSVDTYPLAGVAGRKYNGDSLGVTYLTIDGTEKSIFKIHLLPWFEAIIGSKDFRILGIPEPNYDIHDLKKKNIYFEGRRCFVKEVKRNLGTDALWNIILTPSSFQ